LVVNNTTQPDANNTTQPVQDMLLTVETTGRRWDHATIGKQMTSD
jgi:hypothetical protein